MLFIPVQVSEIFADNLNVRRPTLTQTLSPGEGWQKTEGNYNGKNY